MTPLLLGGNMLLALADGYHEVEKARLDRVWTRPYTMSEPSYRTFIRSYENYWCFTNQNSSFSALDISTGKTKWQIVSITDIPVNPGAVLAEDALHWFTRRVDDKTVSLLALDLTTGNLKLRTSERLNFQNGFEHLGGLLFAAADDESGNTEVRAYDALNCNFEGSFKVGGQLPSALAEKLKQHYGSVLLVGDMAIKLDSTPKFLKVPEEEGLFVLRLSPLGAKEYVVDFERFQADGVQISGSLSATGVYRLDNEKFSQLWLRREPNLPWTYDRIWAKPRYLFKVTSDQNLLLFDKSASKVGYVLDVKSATLLNEDSAYLLCTPADQAKPPFWLDTKLRKRDIEVDSTFLSRTGSCFSDDGALVFHANTEPRKISFYVFKD